MADNRREKEDTIINISSIDEWIKYLEKQLINTNKEYVEDMKIRQRNAQKRLETEREELAEASLKRLYDLEAQGIKMNEQTKIKYLKQLQKEEYNQKLKNEIALLQQTSKQRIKEQEKERKELEREKKNLERLEKGGFGDKLAVDFSKNFNELKKSFSESIGNVGKQLSAAMAQLNNAVNSAITTYSNYQSQINTRLQGSMTAVDVFAQLEKRLDNVSYSPLIRTETLYQNLSALVESGISANVEQRAFLQTVKDNVATTFDANNSSLKRLIRLQQQDSTSARLGFEAYLTSYMNQLVQNTEYLSTTFDNVQAALLEASSLMTTASSTEFEFTVQKWLGTMSGLGLSDETANNLAQAIGYLGSGNIEALSSSSMQNLLVMAASRGGMNYADMLTQGLDSSSVSELLNQVVQYVKEINNTSKSNVVKSQYGKAFGLSVSDIQAISNLTAKDISSLRTTDLTYNQMNQQLMSQMNLVADRMGLPKILENLFSNFQFSTGVDIASNPALYGLWKITDMIQGVTGGINIPSISVLGTGIDLNTTVENLMKTALVGVSTLGNIGSIISGVGQAYTGQGSSLLSALGIGGDLSNISYRGTELQTTVPGFTQSKSTYYSTMAGETYSDYTLQEAEQSGMKKMKETAAVQEETSIDKVYNYLDKEFRDKFDILVDSVNDIKDNISNGVRVYSLFNEGLEI